MAFSIQEIATALGAEAFGATDRTVVRPAEPGEAGPDDLALAMSPKFAEALSRGAARAAVVWHGADWQALGLEAAIVVPRPRLALAGLTQRFDQRIGWGPGCHGSAITDGADLADGASVGPLTVIGRGAVIGQGTQIGAQVTIGPGVLVGADCIIGDGVRIAEGCRLGDRVILQPGAVIGGDGFSFVTTEPSGAEQVRQTLGAEPVQRLSDPTWHRIHSLGGVEIGDDVEIGALSAVDAGTIRATRVGRGTKIDNLVQIGHNVILGQDCLICAQSGVAGSTTIGDRTILGGRTAVADNLTIGCDVVTGGATVVLNRVSDNKVVLGYPAIPMETELSLYKALRRLPRALRDLSALKKTAQDSGGDT